MSVGFIIVVRIKMVGNGSAGQEQNRFAFLIGQGAQLLLCLCEVAVINSAQFIQAVHIFQCFLILIGIGNRPYLAFRCQTYLHAVILGFGRGKYEGVSHPFLKSGMPAVLRPAYRYACRVDFQEFLTCVIKFIRGGRDIDPHLVQPVGVHPHFLGVHTMVAFVKPADSVNMAVRLPGSIYIFSHIRHIVGHICLN